LEDITDRQNATSVNNTIPPGVPINQFVPTFFWPKPPDVERTDTFLGESDEVKRSGDPVVG